jgi:hypothetical protein
MKGYKYTPKINTKMSLGKKFVLDKTSFTKGFKSFTIFKDSDNDRVLDIFDCRPRNPKKQHVTPSRTTEARLERLPIYFTTNPAGIHADKLYTLQGTVIMLDRATGYKKEYKAEHIPKEIRTAITKFYSMIKKRPDTLGEIERTKPYVVIVSTRSEGGAEGLPYLGMTHETIEEKRFQRKKIKGQHAVVIKPVGHQGVKYRKEDIEETAGTVHHELEHVKQFRRWMGKPKLMRRMFKGKVYERKGEQMATKAESKAQKKRYRQQAKSREEFLEGIAKTQQRFDIMEED